MRELKITVTRKGFYIILQRSLELGKKIQISYPIRDTVQDKIECRTNTLFITC